MRINSTTFKLVAGITASVLIIIGWNVWSFDSKPGWTDDTTTVKNDYPGYVIALGRGESRHKRMAEEKARIDGLQKLVQKIKKDEVSTVVDKTDEGTLTTTSFSTDIKGVETLEMYHRIDKEGHHVVYRLMGKKKE